MSTATTPDTTAPRVAGGPAARWPELARALMGARRLLRPLVRTAGTDRPPPDRPTPRVTVVIPCYNYARYLPEAVHSALSQTDVAVDVVVVDDASTDESVAVAQALAESDPRITVLVHEGNAGPVRTFNDGLAAATGDYLVRLDADDVLTPGSLARATALAEAFPRVGMVYGHPVHFSGERARPRTKVKGWTIWRGRDWLALRCAEGVNCITSPEVLMRASVVREVGGQRDLAHTHDMEMWMRLARAADVARVDGPDQAWHREHAASRSAQDVDVLVDLHERAAAFATLLTDGLGDPAEDARLLRTARKALAEEAVARVCQAVTRGWGGNAVTDAYLAFARAQVGELRDLPSARRLRTAQRVGPRWARFVPPLLVGALIHRLREDLRSRLWRWTGL